MGSKKLKKMGILTNKVKNIHSDFVLNPEEVVQGGVLVGRVEHIEANYLVKVTLINVPSDSFCYFSIPNKYRNVMYFFPGQFLLGEVIPEGNKVRATVIKVMEPSEMDTLQELFPHIKLVSKQLKEDDLPNFETSSEEHSDGSYTNTHTDTDTTNE